MFLAHGIYQTSELKFLNNNVSGKLHSQFSSLARYDWAVAIAAHQTQPRSFRIYVLNISVMFALNTKTFHFYIEQYTAHNSEIYSIRYVSIGLRKDIISDCRLPMVVLDRYVFTLILKMVRCKKFFFFFCFILCSLFGFGFSFHFCFIFRCSLIFLLRNHNTSSTNNCYNKTNSRYSNSKNTKYNE